MEKTTDLFLPNNFYDSLIDIFDHSILLSLDEINHIFENFSKRNDDLFFCKLISDEANFDSSFSFFQDVVYQRKLVAKDYWLNLRINENHPFDIELFFEKMIPIVEQKLFELETELENKFAQFSSTGVWVTDPLGNILFKNELAKKILDHSNGGEFIIRPTIKYIDNQFYLICPDIQTDLNITVYYVYSIEENILNEVVENIIKDISIDASILAHEIKNPLTAIRFGAELLQMSDGETKDFANEIIGGVTRGQEIIKVFLEFYKSEKDSLLCLNNFKFVLNTSLKLLASRNRKISFDFKTLDQWSFSIKNESMFILSLYLLFNEILSFFGNDSEYVDWQSELLFSMELKKENRINVQSSILSSFNKFLLSNNSTSELAFIICVFKLNNINLKIIGDQIILEVSC